MQRVTSRDCLKRKNARIASIFRVGVAKDDGMRVAFLAGQGFDKRGALAYTWVFIDTLNAVISIYGYSRVNSLDPVLFLIIVI